MARAFLRELKNSRHPNHMRHDGSRRFYLAVLIERLTSAPRYDISLFGKLCIKLSPHAVHANADGSALRR
jgi:hypothetical protein